MQIEAMVRAVQAKLGVGVDGRAGPETWSAIYKRIVDRGSPADLALTETADRANARSERVIATLHARVQPYARALYFKAREHGLTINIISGLRSYAEQDALYAQGRTRAGKKVTNARGGYSNHNFGIAFDVGLFERNQYLGESPLYKAVGALGEDVGKLALGHMARLIAAMAAAFGQKEQSPDRIEGKTQFARAPHE